MLKTKKFTPYTIYKLYSSYIKIGKCLKKYIGIHTRYAYPFLVFNNDIKKKIA